MLFLNSKINLPLMQRDSLGSDQLSYPGTAVI
jgi:hypothetical protein